MPKEAVTTEDGRMNKPAVLAALGGLFVGSAAGGGLVWWSMSRQAESLRRSLEAMRSSTNIGIAGAYIEILATNGPQQPYLVLMAETHNNEPVGNFTIQVCRCACASPREPNERNTNSWDYQIQNPVPRPLRVVGNVCLETAYYWRVFPVTIVDSGEVTVLYGSCTVRFNQGQGRFEVGLQRNLDLSTIELACNCFSDLAFSPRAYQVNQTGNFAFPLSL